ncbi:MAG: hypothetical protein Fur005_03110 [Roseiflexaceae bacterium]
MGTICSVCHNHHLQAGIDLFNASLFWEAHEAWELGWRESKQPDTTLYQGLIQAAAALVHWQRGNRRGLQRNWWKARPKLVAVRGLHEHLAVEQFLSAMDRFVMMELRAEQTHGTIQLDTVTIPRL